jgi:hypothetical protein
MTEEEMREPDPKLAEEAVRDLAPKDVEADDQSDVKGGAARKGTTDDSI